jgi:kynurenine formamidase
MKIIDISGPIYNGMWSYPGLTQINITTKQKKFHDEEYITDTYEGMNEHTGTYIETPGMWVRHKEFSLKNVPLERLFMVDTYVIQIKEETLGTRDGRPYISVADIKKAEKEEIPEGASILVGTGHGKNWDKKDFIEKSWYFKADAFEYFVEKKLNLVGGDSASWENYKHSEGNFGIFYDAGIILLAPCVNIEKITKYKVKLTVLPLNIPSAKVVPVRAVVVEE